MPTNNVGPAGIGGKMGSPEFRTDLPPAPPGYTWDMTSGRVVPLAGSATDVLAQRTRQQGLEQDALNRTIQATQRRTALEDQDRSSRDQLRSRLISMLDRPTEISSASGVGGGGTGIGREPEVAAEAQVGEAPAYDPTRWLAQFGGSTAGSGASAPATIGTIAVPDNSAAIANIFARAKDKVGLQTQGSLSSLRSALAGRGMLGGGAEVRGAQNVLTAGQGQLGDTTRELAIQEANRANDFAKLGYEGAITQRGQDITVRGQDIQAQEAARDAALRAAQTAYEGGLTQRGQDISQRGQNIGLKETSRGQDITQRGQDISAAEDAANRAAQANRLRYDSVTSLLGKLY